MAVIGETVSELRRMMGFSEEYMGQQLGLSQRQYSRYETGEAQFNVQQLEVVSKLFGMSPVQLLSFDKKAYFQQCTGAMGVNSQNTYNAASEHERALYEARIKHLEEEIHFLRKQIEGLMKS